MSFSPNKKYRMVKTLGWGSFGVVVKAVDDSTGTVIAYKKARTSLRRTRPVLRHESRVLQHLQGHPAVPKLLGYQRVPHYEHIAMELLGAPLTKLLQSEHAMSPTTVLRIGEQLISALQHLFVHNIVHRDIKPGNVCVSVENPAQVCLIDYGISLPLSPAAMATASTKRFDSFEVEESITGSTDWCSINVHDGMWSRPRDDAESLSHMLFYLYFGRIPWRIDYPREDRNEKMRRPLSDLLLVARASVGNGDMSRVRVDMQRIVASSGQNADTPLDWTPAPIPPSAHPLMDFIKIPIDRAAANRKYAEVVKLVKAGLLPGPDPTEPFIGHYWIELDNIPSRDPSLTFPEDEKAFLDSIIPDMGDIEHE